MKIRLIILGMAFVIGSCSSNDQNKGTDQTANSDSTIAAGESSVNSSKINIDSLVNMIASRRGNIESNLESLQKKTLLTSNLRAQIKQKWSKIDYYIENGQVMRIKTHPYKTVSERTEEFYFEQGKLILAFIEDNGEKYTGKSDQRIGKTYYYWEDTVIKEDNPTKEKETSVRNSDSERLLQEAKEYLELMP